MILLSLSLAALFGTSTQAFLSPIHRPGYVPPLSMSTIAPPEKIAGSDKLGLLDKTKTTRAELGSGIKVPPEQQLRIGIIGAGLAGMVSAMDLSEAGHKCTLFESRNFVGGKVSSWQDDDGNHIEMGLHVFFGCYYNLFGIMRRLGIYESSLRLKEHTHTFINKGGSVGMLDFRLGGIGAPINGLAAFARTTQLSVGSKLSNAVALATSPVVRALVDFDGAMGDIRALDNVSFTEWWFSKGGNRDSLNRMWDPIAYALGFIDCDNISARCMLTIFNLFAVRSEASVLRMCEGSPDTYLHKPIVNYLKERGAEIHLGTRVSDIVHDVDENGVPTMVKSIAYTDSKGNKNTEEFDLIIAACDVPGIQKLLPENFRKIDMFDKIYQLTAVPVATVQLRFNGWVTELQDKEKMKVVNKDLSDGKAPGLDNLLYSADADYSCFADLALTSPAEYYKPGEGSLLQCVLTPADKYMGMNSDDIAEATLKQTLDLFPSARGLECTWTNVVKLGQSLYREAPGMDQYRPTQKTPIPNFFLSGSYTYQDYIDSMEGATKSGLACADVVLGQAEYLANITKERKGGKQTASEGKFYFAK